MLKLRDPRSGELTPVTIDPSGSVGLYVCGPTVAGKPHLGHLRTAYAYDVLVRWLRHSGLPVRFVQNVTDVDDKILLKAGELKRDWRELAREYAESFREMRERLGLLEPDSQPRATEHIPEIIQLVELLIARGFAYRADDGSANVYYSVESDPEFGSFTRQSAEAMLQHPNSGEGESLHATGKRYPLDFALWKAHKPGLEPETSAWDSPWGPGRPGWHVEDTAMAVKELGESFSLHGGGRDLRLPHHESEVAQARGAGYPYATLWMHSGLVTVSGAKMAKSKNNFVLAEESYSRDKNALRLLFTRAHYASDVEYSPEEYERADASWRRVAQFLNRVPADSTSGTIPEEFQRLMAHELGTPAAYAFIFELIARGNAALDRGEFPEAQRIRGEVALMLEVLGFELPAAGVNLPREVEELLERRRLAREAKDYSTSDLLREELASLGVLVKDTKAGQELELPLAGAGSR